MDRSLREVELDFITHPEDPNALLRWWQTRIRSGHRINLADLTPEFSIYPEIDRYLLSQSPEVFAVSTVEPGWEPPFIPRTPPHLVTFRKICHKILYALFETYGVDYNELEVSDLSLHYLGWLPNFYTTEGSESEFVASQQTSNGVVVKFRIPERREDFTKSTKTEVRITHLSCYTDTVANPEWAAPGDYDHTDLQLAVEGLFEMGHVALLKSRSCKSRPQTQSIRIVQGLDNLETTDIPDNACFPLIDVFRSSVGWSGGRWDWE